MRHFPGEGEGFDGDGIPWTDEPVPLLNAGVMAHYACRWMRVDVGGESRIIGPHDLLVRHLGRRGRDTFELLPVRLDLLGQLPHVSQHAEPDKVRAFAGGEGSVRSSSGRTDIFHRREIGPRPALDFTRRHTGERPPDGVEGPVEVVYVWDGRREPPAGFPILGRFGGIG